ncbi:MAG: methyltransferase domain-containing protein [Actinomycetota bacterium]|nr:methyltransferase domain-containing protein [Actinomycetota bacterium]
MSPTAGASTTGKVIHWARAYDLLVWVLTLGKERRFRDRLVQLARLAPGESALDVGCGTGALALAAKAAVGSSGAVCGVDASPQMVARARRKAAKADVDVRFETVAVESLPFADGTFDVVMSTLMLHHLTEEGRRQGIAEIARVLKPGGRFFAVDLGGGAERKRHSLLVHRRRHAHFDLDDMKPLIHHAGLDVVEQGTVGPGRVVGISNLRFLLAMSPTKAS